MGYQGKSVDKKKLVKTRLYPRGFEEEENFRTDSPTLNLLDVKAAFLQGKSMERTVYVRLPKEASTNKVLELKKCVYDFSGAGRFWYLKLKEKLIRLGATPSTLDKGIFVWTAEQIVIGIVACFVNDVLWALGRSQEFSSIIKQFKSTFKIGTEHIELLDYIGIHLQQNTDFSIIHDRN